MTREEVVFIVNNRLSWDYLDVVWMLRRAEGDKTLCCPPPWSMAEGDSWPPPCREEGDSAPPPWSGEEETTTLCPPGCIMSLCCPWELSTRIPCCICAPSPRMICWHPDGTWLRMWPCDVLISIWLACENCPWLAEIMRLACDWLIWIRLPWLADTMRLAWDWPTWISWPWLVWNNWPWLVWIRWPWVAWISWPPWFPWFVWMTGVWFGWTNWRLEEPGIWHKIKLTSSVNK